MFERCTEKVHRALFFARYEAGKAGADYIEPEHLLLGLLREEDALFEKLLGHSRGNVALMLLFEQNPGRTSISSQVDLPLSHASKRILEHAAEEADASSGKKITGVHLLLAILREECRAREVLEQGDITAERVRTRIPIGGPDSAALFEGLQERFAPLAAKLTHEIEPAFLFRP